MTDTKISAAYDLEAWHDLFVMVGGVAGALIGLLFVALSINLDRIVTAETLTRRALETAMLLMSVLTLAVLGLVPQAERAVAIAALVLAAADVAMLVLRLREPPAPEQGRRTQVVPAVVLGAFTLPLLLAGVTLLTGAGGGLNWLVLAVIVGFAGAILNAWVLLVEVIR